MGDIATRQWDVIVIGTGIGGGTIGRRLAEKGLSVLFIEKGPDGHGAATGLDVTDDASPAERLRHGIWPDPVRAYIENRESRFFAPIGAGVGGSSIFYAATLERPEPHDLDDSPLHPHPTAGWPVSFAQMLPYFDEAQALYHVSGQPDPLSSYPSPRLAAGQAVSMQDAGIMAQMVKAGLHPYQLHSAIQRTEPARRDCRDDGAAPMARMNGRSAGVAPALATGRAALLDQCEVTQLCGTPGQISHILARRHGQQFRLSARHIVLAAGALSSPRLLIRSRAESWPMGCGNDHDQVGRHLMFHFNEMFALWPKGMRNGAATKSIGFRDLYFAGGERLGMVQSMGLNAGMNEILHFMRQCLAGSPLRRLPGAYQLARIPAMMAAQFLGTAKIFVGLLEDLPYDQNRVMPDPDNPDGILIDYHFPTELLARREHFRNLLKTRMKGLRIMLLTNQPVPNFGHPCGSLRMGLNPRNSVIDAQCRVHGMGNLWVADASFMPTSMGVNPSLTIAANALRVGDAILAAR